MPEHDMDEPVNTDMDPEEALRVLLGEQRRDETDDEDENEKDD